MLFEGICKDKMKGVDEIMKECGVMFEMKIGDFGLNEVFVKCARALKEIYVDYARDVYDEVCMIVFRLMVEIKR